MHWPIVNDDASNDASDYVDANDGACDYVGASDDENDGWWWCLWHYHSNTNYKWLQKYGN